MKTILVILASLGAASCNLDVPDLNNPGLDQLGDHPTRQAVSAACIGLVIGARGNVAQENGYIAQLGILGREAYNFDQADPRYVGELLGGDLNGGSPFGGNFWAFEYANLRLGDTVLHAIDKVTPAYSAEELAAVIGFVKTIQALDLLEVTVTHDSNGEVVDTDHDVHELAPLVGSGEAYTRIATLLEEGADSLDRAGTADFPFALPGGFTGFDTPVTFRTFNRALRARVAAYTGDYLIALDALGESFIDDTATTVAGLDAGVYHTFSTGAGDQTNGLVNPNLYAHPSLEADATAHPQAGTTTPDARFVRKVGPAAAPGTAQGLSSDLAFLIYPAADSPVAIVRNEELILLRAEAEMQTGDPAAALADLNRIRTISGNLDPLPFAADANIDNLLYEREMSLMFEGGFRWIDARRFGRVGDLPTDGFDHINIRYPIPLGECNARVDEPRCALGSH